METIRIEVSSELARRLRPYQSELPRILEWGLRRVEMEHKPAAPNQIMAVLRQVGAVGPEPAAISRYLARQKIRAWKPIRATGKPASEVIIEERNSRPWG